MYRYKAEILFGVDEKLEANAMQEITKALSSIASFGFVTIDAFLLTPVKERWDGMEERHGVRIVRTSPPEVQKVYDYAFEEARLQGQEGKINDCD
jgi:hypothetical protein